MKRLIALFLTVILLAVPVNAQENGDTVSVTYTDGLIYCTPDNINQDVLNIVNKSDEEFKKHLKDNNIVFWGKDTTGNLVVEIISKTTEFSETVGDMNSLKQSELAEFADSIFQNSEYKIENFGIGNEKNVYLFAALSQVDSNGEHYLRQYVTIKQGKLYHILFASDTQFNALTIDQINDILNGIVYENTNVPKKVSDLFFWLVALLILSVAAVAVCIIIIIIRNMKKGGKSEISDDEENKTVSENVDKNKKNKSINRIISYALVLIIGLLSGFVSSKILITRFSQNYGGGFINQTTDNVTINVDESSNSNIEAIAKKVMPCVVYVRTSEAVDAFFGSDKESKGQGSGVIYSEDGYIITNYSTIRDVTKDAEVKIDVFFQNEKDKPIPATLIGYNKSYDLAVIKINATGLVPISIGNASDLVVGRYAAAIGAPGGIDFIGTVTYGVISGVDRSVTSSVAGDTQITLIQSDAIPTSNYTGGALVNINGELIGIPSSAIVEGNITGVGFAIPIDKAMEVCTKIMDNEDTPDPYIGASFSEIWTSERLIEYGFPVGAVVNGTVENGPSAKAGIKKGDIITHFGSVSIDDFNQLNSVIATYKPGKSVVVNFYRDGREYTTSITIGSNNSQ